MHKRVSYLGLAGTVHVLVVGLLVTVNLLRRARAYSSTVDGFFLEPAASKERTP